MEIYPLKYTENWETHVFYISFLNMDISLVMKLTFMKLAIHDAEIHCEGRVSQKFDIGPSFCTSFIQDAYLSLLDGVFSRIGLYFHRI